MRGGLRALRRRGAQARGPATQDRFRQGKPERIALRVLTADPGEAVDEAFFARKIAQAVQLRRETLKLDTVTDAYRVVHSEGDGLSGLVVAVRMYETHHGEPSPAAPFDDAHAAPLAAVSR